MPLRGKIAHHPQNIAASCQKPKSAVGKKPAACTTVHGSGLETVIRIV
jgi:hypothetical protein